MRRVISVLLFSLLASGPVVAQSKSTNAPIEVSADSFVADMNSKSGTYSGNVIVKQGDIRMRANSIRVNVVGGKPDKILANGNVVVDSPSGTVSGDAGVYDVAPRLITLTGKVTMMQNKNRMTGHMLVVNLVTGKIDLDPRGTTAAGQPARPGTRVQGVFSAPPPSNPKPTP